MIYLYHTSVYEIIHLYPDYPGYMTKIIQHYFHFFFNNIIIQCGVCAHKFIQLFINWLISTLSYGTYSYIITWEGYNVPYNFETCLYVYIYIYIVKSNKYGVHECEFVILTLLKLNIKSSKLADPMLLCINPYNTSVAYIYDW